MAGQGAGQGYPGQPPGYGGSMNNGFQTAFGQTPQTSSMGPISPGVNPSYIPPGLQGGGIGGRQWPPNDGRVYPAGQPPVMPGSGYPVVSDPFSAGGTFAPSGIGGMGYRQPGQPGWQNMPPLNNGGSYFSS